MYGWTPSSVPKSAFARAFDEHRAHLRAVAYRMLGSRSEAEDAVQEAWLRLSRADTSEVGNFGGWLTTVVSRICLDMLRAREARREEPLESREPDRPDAGEAGPDHEMLLADSLGAALLVVLDTLAPAERLAFVLHDLFGVPFEEIAPIVGRTATPGRARGRAAARRLRLHDRARADPRDHPGGRPRAHSAERRGHDRVSDVTRRRTLLL